MQLTSAVYSLNSDRVQGYGVSASPNPETLLPLDATGKFPASVLPESSGTSGDYLRKNSPDTSRGTNPSPMLLVSNEGELSGDGINGRSIAGIGISGRSENNDGVVGWTGERVKSGVFGHSASGSGVTGRSDTNDGTVGWTGAGDKSGVRGSSTDGRGVLGRSDNNDGVVGWTGADDKSGVFGHSQGGIGVTARSENNDGLLSVTTSRFAFHAAIRARNEGAGGLAIVSEGDLFITGAFKGDIGPNGGASFPRPGYDSGWQSFNWDESKTLLHHIGGNIDNYVVDIQLQGSQSDDDKGRHNMGVGGDKFSNIGFRGVYWSNLTTTSIKVTRESSDLYADKIRVRIWVYK
jgi:hypothetical protein